MAQVQSGQERGNQFLETGQTFLLLPRFWGTPFTRAVRFESSELVNFMPNGANREPLAVFRTDLVIEGAIGTFLASAVGYLSGHFVRLFANLAWKTNHK